MEQPTMNTNIMQGKWQQLKGKARARWGKLTDDDLAYIQGNGELAAGRIRERYGIAKEDAEREWAEFRKECCGGEASAP
jgi:uncharacterized protein YjbJ (UPF0337 family)